MKDDFRRLTPSSVSGDGPELLCQAGLWATPTVVRLQQRSEHLTAHS